MKKQNSIYTLLIALLCFVSSCDYLGVSDQLAGGLQNTEQVLIMYRIQRDGMPMFLPVSPIIQGLTA